MKGGGRGGKRAQSRPHLSLLWDGKGERKRKEATAGFHKKLRRKKKKRAGGWVFKPLHYAILKKRRIAECKDREVITEGEERGRAELPP